MTQQIYIYWQRRELYKKFAEVSIFYTVLPCRDGKFVRSLYIFIGRDSAGESKELFFYGFSISSPAVNKNQQKPAFPAEIYRENR